MLIFLIIFCYLFSFIPWGYLVSKAKGVDIRKVGSGNIAGTNIIWSLGTKRGLLAGVLDALKGAIPIYLTDKFKFLAFDWRIVSVAITPVLGHIFPFWLAFKAGKGVATTLGILFFFLGWKLLLPFLLIWLLVLAIYQISSFSNLLMVSYLPLILWLISFSLAYFIFRPGLICLNLVGLSRKLKKN